MSKVDSKGRIVLPREVRERLGVTPGTEVEVREEDGKAVVEPEDDSDRIIERMDAIVGEISDREPMSYGDLDPRAREQVDSIRRQAERTRTVSDGSYLFDVGVTALAHTMSPSARTHYLTCDGRLRARSTPSCRTRPSSGLTTH